MTTRTACLSSCAAALLLAIAPQPAASAAEVAVPIYQTVINPTKGAIRQSVFVRVGNSAPIQVVLDTGSSGLRIFAGALKPADYTETGIPSAMTYGSGLTISGTIGMAKVSVGGLSTAGPIPFEIIKSYTGTMSNYPGGPIDGLQGIMGIEMTGGTHAVNPLMYIGDARWILNLPLPGDSANGSLVLNADPAPDFRLLQLAHATKVDPNDLPPGGVATGWASNEMAGCVNNLDTGEASCQTTLMDTGAWGFHESGYSGAVVTWPNGTHASFTFQNAAGATVIQQPFVVGQVPGSTVILPAPKSGADEKGLNTGAFPFFYYSVLFDTQNGTIGVRPRSAHAALNTVFREYDPAKGWHMMTLYPVEKPRQYYLEGVGFQLYANETDPNAIQLYRCSWSDGYFVSIDPNCEGKTYDYPLGWAHVAPVGAEVPIYRFYSPWTGDLLITVNPAEGYRNGYRLEEILGYALP